jgi:predicted HTH transcriptional regulator
LSVQEIAQQKLEAMRPQELTDDEIEDFDDEHFQKVEKAARIEVYEEIEKLISTVQEFLQISKPSAKQLERVSDILREESISHEFKASLRKPYPDYPELVISKEGKETFTINKQTFLSKKQIHTYFQDIILKTIASLLNTKGGQLVIGIHEFGNKKVVVGIDREGFQSHDEYERHLIQLIKNAFGASVIAGFVTTNIEKVDDEYVCVVTCKRYEGDELIWFQDKLFVRTGPRVDELRGIEQAQFILQRQHNRTEKQ